MKASEKKSIMSQFIGPQFLLFQQKTGWPLAKLHATDGGRMQNVPVGVS